MQIGPASGRQPREIACDESGYEGEKLVGGETEVFAHASVALSAGSAASCLTELRRRIRSPALEYKANHLLREKHRPVLGWLLGPRGPIHGVANVHLVDKTFLVVSKIVDVLQGDGKDERADPIARTLYREGRRAFERDRWAAFLASSNNLMLMRNRRSVLAYVDSFARTVDVLRAGTSGEASDILGLVRAELLENPGAIPALDLLVPAIVAAVLAWTRDGKPPVSIIHDRQTALTDERIAQIKAILGGPAPRLIDLRLVASRSDRPMRSNGTGSIGSAERGTTGDAGRGVPSAVAVVGGR